MPATRLQSAVISVAGLVGVALLHIDAASAQTLPHLSAATPAAFAGACDSLSAALANLGPTTAITAASTVAAGPVANVPVPEHCLVVGAMNRRVSTVDGKPYAIGFEMRLPRQWNGRFYHQANGGTDGAIQPAVGALGGGPVTGALAKGFAVLSSDAGHPDFTTPFFALDPQARLDYGYSAVAQLTPMAKRLIQSVYGKAPDRSYIGGCSNGGRHALVAATRYGDMYDGVLAGSPGYNLPKAAVAQLWGVQQYAKVATATKTTDTNAAGQAVALSRPLPDVATAFTPAERAMIAAKIVGRCDALDGATDNWVGNVAACQKAFSVANDIPTCTGARDGTCLSSEQKSVLASVHAGARNAPGERLYNTFPFDRGISGAGWAAWKFANSTGVGRDPGATAFIFMTPPLTTDTANFLGLPFAMGFDVDKDAPKIFARTDVYTESAMSFMTPQPIEKLATLQGRGGKMIVYHGTADAVFSVDDTAEWIDGVRRQFADHERFARFYPVPGMGHCTGGPAADRFDLLEPLVDWVEKGIAPGAVEATARGAGTSSIAALVNPEVPADWAPNRSRPLCPYPSTPTYKGSGDVNLAASYSCQ